MSSGARALLKPGSSEFKLPNVEQGRGAPIVLVHGSNSDQRIWDQHRQIIAARYRVIAVSQRYFGRDPWPDNGESFGISVHADDLAIFVRDLAIGPVTIVGWSYGGAVSLTMAVRNPSLVNRLILYEPSLATFVTSKEEARAAMEDRLAMMTAAKPLAAAGDLAGAVRVFMDGVNAEAGPFDRLPPEVRAVMIENAPMLPLLFAGPPLPSVTADDLRALDIPVSIMLGRDSRTGYQIAARAAQALLPRAELTVVNDARHLWPIQNPQGSSQSVVDVLERA